MKFPKFFSLAGPLAVCLGLATSLYAGLPGVVHANPGKPGSAAGQAMNGVGSGAKQPLAIVLNSRDASVSLIDQSTYTVVAQVSVGKEPHHLYPVPDGRSLIVANAATMSDRPSGTG